ncbi:rho-related GTP-binding protein RhoU-like [Salarias fasciatus]|uniref:Rho-related GTP-binding protein RhoU-like n=1 Tax=Salarias fasciatus TaxID=181472 RepID=A0A672FMT7_SALFA|nr:rho-related GTP-binding protein RhoU-like [Salarias fasciatus]
MLPQDTAEQQKCRRVSDPVCGPELGPAPPPPPPPRRARNRDKRRRSGSAPERRVSCVLVGDAAVGKTSLVLSYTTNGFPADYVPTALDNFTVMVAVDGKPVRLQLCDTAGQDDLDRLGPLVYRTADVFLLVYSVVRPASLQNLARRWVPEIRRQRPGAPLVLVGTQLDLREDVQVLIQLARRGERPLDAEDGRRRARQLGAAGFAECSALTQQNLKDAFDAAILAGVRPPDRDQDRDRDQRLTLRKKTPEKIRSLSAAWWTRISCLVGGGGPDGR